MGTRSTIALEFADGTVEQVYCHWDGYLDHNGQLLQAHYSDPFELQKLLALGAFSSLCATVAETKETAYHFSRGEELCIDKFKDYADYYTNAQREEYNYILRNVNGKATWFVEFYACEGGFVTLEDAFEIKEEVDAE